MIKERERRVGSGIGMLVVLSLLFLVAVGALIFIPPVIIKVVAGLWLLINLFLFFGLFYVNPNEGRVIQLFGEYKGTTRQEGLRWANPFFSKKRLSLRIRNFETGRMKVNDIDGNPIEIATIVVWKVVDTAEACFEVDNYEQFVKIQSEAAVRNLATQHPYDTSEVGRTSLRGDTAAISEQLRDEIQERLDKAGVEVLEARISHLAYSPEIAEAMLRRQQAGAIVAARQLIVEGAVGMVEMALEQLSEKQIIDFDQGRKAAMVSNLLVVLCGETATQPVVNAGSSEV